MMTFVPILVSLLLAESFLPAQAVDYVAEVYFVVEPQVVRNYMKLGYDNDTATATIKGDVDFLMHGVNQYYKGMANRGNESVDIEVRVKQLDILDDEVYPDCSLVGNSELEGSFGMEKYLEWLETNDIYKKHGYDLAIIWTGYQLLGEKSITGVAAVGSVCNPGLAVGIVEFDGTQFTAGTTAHEIAHILGASHDESCGNQDGYIMSRSSSSFGTHGKEFSNCSVLAIGNRINELNGRGKNCMNKTNTTTQDPGFEMSSQLGRDILDPQNICQRAQDFNESAYFCPYGYGHLYEEVVKGDQVCNRLYCSTSTVLCNEALPSDGMVCDVGKRCDQGKCVATPSDFPAPKNILKDCIYGDAKRITWNDEIITCDENIRRYGVGGCYIEDVYAECCATCNSKKGKIKGCEYGDKVSSCVSYQPDEICPSNADDCCYTCRDWKGKRSASKVPLLLPKTTRKRKAVPKHEGRGAVPQDNRSLYMI